MENQANAPSEMRAIVNFLRNKAGMKTKIGILNGKRVDYFKGRSAVKAVLSPAYAKLKGVPKVTSEEEAVGLLHACIPFTFFLRVARANATPHKMLQITPQQLFVPDEYYAWFVDPNPIKSLLAAGAMVAVVLAGVMFPLWPLKMRIGVWYLSMGVLGLIGLFFATAIVRLIVWCVTVVVLKPGIWIFPNLFADVGFVDSFIPLWGWDVPPPKKGKSSGGSSKKSGEKKEKKRSSKRVAAQQEQEQIESAEASDAPKIVEINEGEDDE